MKVTHAYDDIIDLPHHQSSVHPHMPLADRAAQFSPFAALTGHEAAIRETGRVTEREMDLDENMLEELEEKLHLAERRSKEGKSSTFTWFVPDERKSGGAYVTHTGRIRKIGLQERVVILEDRTRIPIGNITGIDAG